MNSILTSCICPSKCYLFRLAVLLVFGMFLIVIAMFVVIRWYNSVNYARMRLLALGGLSDAMTGARVPLAGGFVTV